MTLFLKLLAPIVLVLCALTQAGLAYWWKDQRTKAHKRVRTMLIVLLIVSGVCSIVVVVTGDRDSEDLKNQLRSIESKLDPFIELAKARFPGLDSTAALKRLSTEIKDLESKTKTLEKIAKAVTSFETEVMVTVSGNWVATGAPHANIMVMGDTSDEYLDIKLKDGSTKRVPLFVQGGATISKLDANTSIVRYRTKVKPGDWPINEDSGVFQACKGIGVVAWGINKSYVTDGMIVVKRIDVRVFINGQKKLLMAAQGGVPFALPSEGSAKLDIRKYQEFETGI